MNAFLCIVLSNFFVRLFSLLLLTFSLLTSRMYLLCSQRWPCLTRFRSDDDGNGLHFTDILCLLRCPAESVTSRVEPHSLFHSFFLPKKGWREWRLKTKFIRRRRRWRTILTESTQEQNLYACFRKRERKEKKRKERVDQPKLWLLWMHSFLPLLKPVAVVLIIDDDDLSFQFLLLSLELLLVFRLLDFSFRRMMLLAWEGFRECLLLLLMDNLRFQISTFAYIFQFYSRMNRYVSFAWK